MMEKLEKVRRDEGYRENELLGKHHEVLCEDGSGRCFSVWVSRSISCQIEPDPEERRAPGGSDGGSGTCSSKPLLVDDCRVLLPSNLLEIMEIIMVYHDPLCYGNPDKPTSRAF